MAGTADSVIVASGGSLRTLRVPGEDKFIGRGVSQCASCDGPLYQGDDVIVVGGGDAAAQEALSLSNVCRSVTMICRSGLRARSHYVERIEANKAISVMSNHVVLEILGEGRVSGARVRNLENDSEPVIACRMFRLSVANQTARLWRLRGIRKWICLRMVGLNRLCQVFLR